MGTKLNTGFIGKVRLHYGALESTNDFLLQKLAQGPLVDGTVVSTDFQTRGRGQQANTWQSLRNENLLFSMVLYPPGLNLSRSFNLNRFAALAVRDTVNYYISSDVEVKWPNDVYISGQKVAGILIQNGVRGHEISHTVLGIGLNVNQSTFATDLSRATSLRKASGTRFDREEVFERLLEYLNLYYTQMQEDPMQIAAAYERHLYQKDTWAQYKLGEGNVIKAKIEGVESDGKLRILLFDGSRKFLAHHEIAFL